MKIFRIVFRSLLLIAYLVLAFIFKLKIFNQPFYWYLPLYLYFLYLGIECYLPFAKWEQKRYLKSHYKKTTFDTKKFYQNEKKATKGAILILIIWLFSLSVLGILFYFKIVNRFFLYGLVFLFNLFDAFCLAIKCPFKIILKNTCCMDCRINGYDTFFSFSPLIFTLGFFPTSLVSLGIINLILFEILYHKNKEHFYRNSNPLINCTICPHPCNKKKE